VRLDVEEATEARLRDFQQARVRSGRHGGYERTISMSASASRATAAIVATTSSRAGALELRVIEASDTASPSLVATVRLVLVSTVPGSAGLMATTPVGIAETRSSTRFVADSCATAASPTCSIASVSWSSNPR
jgi:hypothetical protein